MQNIEPYSGTTLRMKIRAPTQSNYVRRDVKIRVQIYLRSTLLFVAITTVRTSISIGILCEVFASRGRSLGHPSRCFLDDNTCRPIPVCRRRSLCLRFLAT